MLSLFEICLNSFFVVFSTEKVNDIIKLVLTLNQNFVAFWPNLGLIFLFISNPTKRLRFHWFLGTKTTDENKSLKNWCKRALLVGLLMSRKYRLYLLKSPQVRSTNYLTDPIILAKKSVLFWLLVFQCYVCSKLVDMLIYLQWSSWFIGL